MTYFNGESFTEREDESARTDLPRDIKDNNHKGAPASFHGQPNTRRLGEDQPCGGGRRVIRKRIGD